MGQPRPGALVRPVHAQRPQRSATPAGPRGLWRLVNRAAHRLRANAPLRARDNIAGHYDLGNDFYAAWLDRG